MSDEEKRAWVNAIIGLCEVQILGGDTVYPMLEGILVKGEPVLNDYPLSYYVVDELDAKYHVKYCNLVERTRTCWRCSPKW